MWEHTNAMKRDRTAEELAAWGAKLREQGERLAREVDFLLDRVAQTEEHVAHVFAYRALTAHHGADELLRYARQAQSIARQLRTRRKHTAK
jgi:hypothetical protein